MAGLLICFVLPGILIGLMLGEGVRSAQKKARLEKKRAQKNVRQLYVYDLRNDIAA